MQNKSGKFAIFYKFSRKSFGSSGKSSTFASAIEKRVLLRHGIGVWCNGNTADSGPAFPGSSPGTPTKKNPANWRDFFLFLILSVDSLDFLSDEIHIVLQFLDLAVHLIDEAVALLR